MIKIKLVFERENKKFGDREETHFVKLPNSALPVIYQTMNENEFNSIEDALLFMMRQGIKSLEAQHEATKEQEQPSA